MLYQKNVENTIITWPDKIEKTDIALSFQESSGCSEIWHQIHACQDYPLSPAASNPDEDFMLQPDGGDENINPVMMASTIGYVDSYQQDHQSGYYGSVYGPNMGQDGPMTQSIGIRDTPVEFPEPRLDTIQTIASLVAEASLFQRESIARQLVKPGYLRRVLECFDTAEDLEDEEGIKAAFVFVKGAILLNDTALLELLFSEDHIMQVVGALEYDPTVPADARLRHRDQVKGMMSLREVIPIQDASCRAKILQAHRINYVKDKVLPRSLDDSTYATLSSIQLFNTVEVLLSLHSDRTFFPDLFAALKKSPKQSQGWRDLVFFLQEIISLTRHLQATQRNSILMQMYGLGLFKVLSDILDSEDDAAKLRAADVLLGSAVHDASTLRSYIERNEEGKVLFGQLVKALLRRSPGGLQEQALDVIKVLLDPETMESNEKRDKFIEIFYDGHVEVLMGVIADSTGGTAGEAASPTTLLLIVELLCYCVSQHSYRIKYYILRNNTVEKVLRLLDRPEKAVAASALRFLKTCVTMKDEFYNRYLVKNSLLEPVIQAYIKYHKKENLLHSAILDFLDLLRRENMKSLLAAVVTSPKWPEIESFTQDKDLIQSVKMKYESNQEANLDRLNEVQRAEVRDAAELEKQRLAAAETAKRTRGERDEDADEEKYFRDNEDDGDIEDLHQVTGQVLLESSPGLPRIVDYDEDEDEDTIPLNGM